MKKEKMGVIIVNFPGMFAQCFPKGIKYIVTILK